MEQSQTYNLQLNKRQVMNLIRQLNYNDKLSIIKKLNESAFIKRFEKLLDSLKTDELTFEEITKEVEIVRQKRYEEGKHNI